MLLPKDIFSDEIVVPASLDEFSKLKDAIMAAPNDLKKWDSLVTKIDETLSKVQKNVSAEFKSLINRSYEEVLDRFPYLVEYWKKWAVLSYKIDGLQESIRIMSKSVEACQFSVELWEDYLNALALDNSSEYEAMLALSIQLNGHHFNGHVLWDKFTKLHKQKNSGVLEVYLKLIRIPMYEYARYYSEFSEINKQYELEQIVPEEELKTYLTKFGKTNVGECSQFEKHQIIDEFSYDMFVINQTKVTRKWEFEKQLTTGQFSGSATSNEETEVWIQYLDSEIANYSDSDFNTVINIFERSLVPNCFQEKIWLKYLAFLNKYSPEETKFKLMDAVYSRCINKFLPLDTNFIRFNYCKFLMRHGKLESMHDYISDLIRYFSGSNKHNLMLKQAYTDSVECYLHIIKDQVGTESFRSLLKDMLDCFLEQNKKLAGRELAAVDFKYITQLFNRLNNQSILVVSKMYLDELLSDSDKDGIYGFFNYHSNPIFKESVSFWKFYVEYEAFVTQNFVNLNNIVNYITKNTTLPKIVINKFITLRYNIFNSDISQFKHLINDASIVKHDLQVSMEVQNKEFWLSYQKPNKDLKMSFDNPGLNLERPEITNKQVDFSIFDEEMSLPTFRNVEKANMSVKYPS